MSVWTQPELDFNSIEQERPYCWQCDIYGAGESFFFYHQTSLNRACPAYKAKALSEAGLPPFLAGYGLDHYPAGPRIVRQDIPGGMIRHYCVCGRECRTRQALSEHLGVAA